MSLSREKRIYLALWRKAYRSNEEVIVKASSTGIAVSMRMGMYRAIAPYREGVEIDDELKAAADKLVVHLDEKNSRLILRERKTLEELDAMLEELGITEKDLQTDIEKNMDQTLDNLLKGETKRSTPFYNRED